MKRFFLSYFSDSPRRLLDNAAGIRTAGGAGRRRVPDGTRVCGVCHGRHAGCRIGWRDFLTDPRLRRLVEIALANNRDLRVAMLNVAQVQAQYRIQRAALAPQVSGFADGSHSRTPGSLSKSGTPLVTHAYETGVSAAWEVDLFGRLRSLSDAALEQYFATAYARQAAEILLVSQVADQYLTTLAFDEQLAVTRQTLADGTGLVQDRQAAVRYRDGAGAHPPAGSIVVEQANANYARRYELARKPRTAWCC